MKIEVEWARMTAPELRAIAAREGALAILPAGSLEQHGPHLPVITDTASASAAAIAAARLVANDVPVAVLPGLWLGLSEHHLPFGGTISVDYAAYRAILESIVRSLRAIGFAPPADRQRSWRQHRSAGGGLARAGGGLRLSDRCDHAVVFGAREARSDLRGRYRRQTCLRGRDIDDDGDRGRHREKGQARRSHAAGARAGRTRRPASRGSIPSPSARRSPAPGATRGVATAEKGTRFLAVQAEALAEAIRNKVLWSRPDPVWRKGRGQETTAGAVTN